MARKTASSRTPKTKPLTIESNIPLRRGIMPWERELLVSVVGAILEGVSAGDAGGEDVGEDKDKATDNAQT